MYKPAIMKKAKVSGLGEYKDSELRVFNEYGEGSYHKFSIESLEIARLQITAIFCVLARILTSVTAFHIFGKRVDDLRLSAMPAVVKEGFAGLSAAGKGLNVTGDNKMFIKIRRVL